MARATWTELRALAGIAAPLAVTQASQLVMSLAASVMLGRVSGSALAAGGLCAIFIQALSVVSQGVIAGAHPLMAAARGRSETQAGEQDGAAYALGGAILAGIIFSLVSVAILLNLSAVLARFGVAAEILRDVEAFLRYAAFGLPAILWIAPIRLYCSVAGKSWLIMASVGFGALCYVPLLSGLTFGAFGRSGLGIAGAGLAYGLAWWMIAGGLTAFAIIRKHVPLSTFRRAFPTSIAAFRDVWSIGWPIALIYAAELGMTVVLTLVTSGFGTIAIIANQIAYTLNSIAFNPIVAIGQAATVRVAYHRGAGREVAARLAGNLALAAAAGLMAVSGMILLVFSQDIIGLFLVKDTADFDSIAALARVLIMILAAFLVFDGLQSAANGALRGLKDTRVPLVLGLCGYWLFGVPVAIGLSFGLGMGVTGVWFGILAGITSVALTLVLRWRSLAVAATEPATRSDIRWGRSMLRRLTSPT